MVRNDDIFQTETLLPITPAIQSAEKDIPYLRKHIAVFDPFVLKTIQLDFLKELKAAVREEQSSLPFIRHKVATTSLVQTKEVFQVMVIGGSVFRTALMQKTHSEMKILDMSEEPLPTFLTKESFLAFIDAHLNRDISVLAVNFAYPVKPVLENGKADGILLSAMKEHAFVGLIGERVGKTIEDHIAAKYQKSISVALANDTVCLLLSGLTQYTSPEIAGGILGTGTNFALFLDADVLVNLESSNFDKFPWSDELKILDATSQSPGKALFEKETAGGYLYKHFNIFLQRYQLPYPPLESTLALKKLAEKNVPMLSSVALLFIEKSAALMAAQIAAIALFQENPALTFVMEGSFFWDDMYQQFLRKYLHLLYPGNSFQFVQITDGIYLGGAKLVA